MDAIASEAGMARSHLYYHFKGKGELFDALIDLRMADIRAAGRAVIDELDAAGATEASAGPEYLIRAVIKGVLEPYRDFFRLLVAEAIRRPDLPPAMLQLLHGVSGAAVGRLGWTRPAGCQESAELFYMLIAPALFAVVLPVDPTGGLDDPADVAPYLAMAQDRFFPPDGRAVPQGKG